MGKVIRMIPTSKNNYIFLYGITDNDEVIFRSSYNIKYLQREKITIENNICYTNSYSFYVEYLSGLPILK